MPDFYSMMCDADALPYGVEQYYAYKEIYELAEREGNLEEKFYVRSAFANAALFSGFEQVTITQILWCLAQIDKYPDKFENWEVLWTYKNVMINLPLFATVPRKQIDDLFADFSSRLKKEGDHSRTLAYVEWEIAIAMKNFERARELQPQWTLCRRDRYSHCPACELSSQVHFLIQIDAHEEAIEKALPLLNNSKSCAEEPHRTLSRLLDSYYTLDLEKEGEQIQKRGYRLIRKTPSFLTSVGSQIIYLVRTDSLRKAMNQFQRHLEWLNIVQEGAARFSFCLAGLHLLNSPTYQNRETIPIRIPFKAPFEHTPKGVARSDLLNYLQKECQTLATTFDTRNGNNWYAEQLKQLI